MAIHVALIELGLDFELENAGNPRSEQYLKINPRGSVPTLQIDDFILREGAAILTYLLDSHENSLLPKSGLERAKALEWLSFANSTLHPAYSRLFFQLKVLGKEASKNPLYKPSIKAVQKYWDEIEERLVSNNYICGNDCTIADILLTVIANWSSNFGEEIVFGEKTKNLFKRIISRPSYKRALETEKVTYKVI
jgi:glutathione S-transferase